MSEETRRLPDRVLWQIFAAVGSAFASLAGVFGGDAILAFWFGAATAVIATGVAFEIREFRREGKQQV